jgi:hypothetical protein
MNDYRGIRWKNIMKASDTVLTLFTAKEYCQQHAGQQQKHED